MSDEKCPTCGAKIKLLKSSAFRLDPQGMTLLELEQDVTEWVQQFGSNAWFEAQDAPFFYRIRYYQPPINPPS